MTEAAPTPQQPNERHTGPSPELPLREVYKLPSGEILDGIYTGRFTNPSVLHVYFVRQRSEFLEAHPEREHELDGPGEIGRWHGLVYSETVDEYAGLAAFAESEVHRRSAALPDEQADSPVHLQGVANFRRIADVWRQKAIRLSETEPGSQPMRLPGPPTVTAHEVTQPETHHSASDYSRMRDYEVLDGINNGTLTDTEAVHVYVSKSLNSVRELYEGDERREKETEYAELLYGAPEDMIGFCLRQASERTAYGAPGALVSPANYKIAGRWYAMAGRFAEEAANSHPEEDPQVSEER